MCPLHLDLLNVLTAIFEDLEEVFLGAGVRLSKIDWEFFPVVYLQDFQKRNK